MQDGQAGMEKVRDDFDWALESVKKNPGLDVQSL
jgi:hypothetical protein